MESTFFNMINELEQT